MGVRAIGKVKVFKLTQQVCGQKAEVSTRRIFGKLGSTLVINMDLSHTELG